MKKTFIFKALFIIACLLSIGANAQNTKTIQVGGCEFQIPKYFAVETLNNPYYDGIVAADNERMLYQIYLAYCYKSEWSLEVLSNDMLKEGLNKIGSDLDLGEKRKTTIDGFDAYVTEIKYIKSGIFGGNYRGHAYTFVANGSSYMLVMLNKISPFASDKSSEIIKTIKIKAPTATTRTSEEALQQYVNLLRPQLPQKVEDGVILDDFYIQDNLIIVTRLDNIDLANMSSTEIESTKKALQQNLASIAFNFLNISSDVGNYVADGHGITIKVLDKNKKLIVESSYTSEQLLSY